MTPPRDPRQAFAGACLAAALSAKLGECRIGEARKLMTLAVQLLPGDERAAAAAFEFGWQIMVDQATAAANLQRYVDGVVARIAPDPGAVQHDWQTRADLA